MVAKRDRMRIEVYSPAGEPETAPECTARTDDAVLCLARLIGRQIAREQFERRQAKERRLESKLRAGEPN